MAKRNYFILIFGMLSIFSCADKISIIEDFHDKLESSTTESLLTDFFEFPNTTSKDNLTPTYKEQFIVIKSYKALGPYDILKYKDARKNWVGVSKFIIAEKLSQTYVVKYSNNEYLYIRFSKGKIQSMLPIKKGDDIAGWL